MKKLLLLLVVALITLLCAASSENAQVWLTNAIIVVGVLTIIVGAIMQIIERKSPPAGSK